MNDILESLGPMRTHCIGRYLIDLPEALELNPQSDAELIYGLDKNHRKVKVQVPTGVGGRSQFDRILASRVSELKKDHHFKAPTKSMLVAVTPVEPVVQVVRGYASPDMLNYFSAEVFAMKGNATIITGRTVYKTEQPEVVEAQLLRISQGISVPEDLSKAGPGSCLGPAVINAGQDGEWFSVNWIGDRWPDLSFRVYINSLLEESDGGLLARSNRKLGDLRALGAKFDYIRKGKLKIAGRSAEELLTKGIEYGKVERHFKAEISVTKPSNFAEPFISFEMLMGGAKDAKGDVMDPSLSEEQALALWDAVLKSVRLRPGAVAGGASAR